MKELERVLKALANKRRLSIVKYIRDEREAPVGEISRYLKISFKATSKHLLILSKTDILDKEQKGKEVYYFLVTPPSSIVKHILEQL